MPGALRSKIDTSVLNAMRAWRRCAERRADEKLALLRRLRRQYETGSLPTYKETQVEQSFNEQIFSNIFDYRTILSHDERKGRHDLSPKLSIKETSKFPDFSLGLFVDGTRVILASAELKGPGVDLDRKQRGDYEGLTAVQQAFQAVKGSKTCRWVIACNYRELRLYRRIDLAHDDDTPPDAIVVANLHDVRDKNDLARLCAHFDRRALLGTPTLTGEPRSELMAALERHHPATPIAYATDHVRAVFLFTPQVEEDFALFKLERRLRESIAKSVGWPLVLGALGSARPAARFKLAEGCISAIGKDAGGKECCKVSLSGLGQLQVSVSRELDAQRAIDTDWLVTTARFFMALVDDVFDGLNEATRPGRVSPELRDVQDVTLEVVLGHRDAMLPSSGKAGTNDVLGVDFAYTPVFDNADQLVADMVSELAIYFRAADGGVGIDRVRVVRGVK